MTSLQLVMDAATGAVSAIDPFSSWLPLPFRVAILLVLGTDILEQSFVLNEIDGITGIWAWGSNLHYLCLIKIVCSPFSKPYTADQV